MKNPTKNVGRLAAILLIMAMVSAACATETTTTTTSTSGAAAAPTTEAVKETAPPTTVDVATVEEGEPVTLLVWSKESGNANAIVLDTLDRAFEALNPGVTVERVNRGFDDYNVAIKIAATSDDPPDVFQVSTAYKGMGPMVEAGTMMPLNDLAEEYGWYDRLGAAGVAGMSFSADGKQFGGENLYGLPMSNSVVGIFYNKPKLEALGLSLPTTFDEFEAALATAKGAGEVPIMLGNGDQWPAIMLLGPLQASMLADTSGMIDWLVGAPGATIDIPETVAAAAAMQSWARSGYFEEGFNGFPYTDSLAAFVDGTGLFMFMGEWANKQLQGDMGEDLGFFLMPTADGSLGATTGSGNSPWGISSKTDNLDLAVAYLDLITGPAAADVIVANWSLPATPNPLGLGPAEGTAQESIFEAYDATKAGGLQIAFLDGATLTIYGPIVEGAQELLADRITPEEYVTSIQTSYEEWHASR